MSKASKKTTGTTKKGFRKEVAGTLKEVFTDIQATVGNKKFDKKIKKASKIIAAGALPKKETAKTKPAEKAVAEAKKQTSKSSKDTKKAVKEKAPVKKAKTTTEAGTDTQTSS